MVSESTTCLAHTKSLFVIFWNINKIALSNQKFNFSSIPFNHIHVSQIAVWLYNWSEFWLTQQEIEEFGLLLCDRQVCTLKN